MNEWLEWLPLLVAPLPFVGNDYTLVGTERVEIAAPGIWPRRETLANGTISGLYHVYRDKKGGGRSNRYYVEYEGDRILSSEDHLDGWGKKPKTALDLLSRATGIPISSIPREDWIEREISDPDPPVPPSESPRSSTNYPASSRTSVTAQRQVTPQERNAARAWSVATESQEGEVVLLEQGLWTEPFLG